MLTIQPNFSQRLHSQTSFRSGYGTAELDNIEAMADRVELNQSRNLPAPIKKESKKDTLENLQEDLNDAVTGLKKLEDKVPESGKKILGGLALIGSGAVVGISTKFGWSETGKVLNKVAKSEAVQKFAKNIKTLGKKIGEKFEKVKDTKMYKSVAKKFAEWSDKFAKTKFGGKVCDLFKKFNDSKPVIAVKSFFGKTKNVKAGQVADTTGDVVAVATGVSTTAAGALGDNKNSEDKTDSKADKKTIEDADYEIVD